MSAAAKAQKKNLTGRFPAGETQLFKKSQLVYGVSARALNFYQVVSGRVAIEMRNDQGGVTGIRLLQAGDFFGEDSLASVRRRQQESARAIDKDTTVIWWSGLVIRDLMSVDSELAINLFDLMLNKVVDWRTFFQMDRHRKYFKHKLAVLLLKMAKRGVSDGEWLFMPPVTHQMLGRMLGTSREIVSHAMGSLRRAGYIRYNRKGIAIYLPSLGSFKASVAKT